MDKMKNMNGKKDDLDYERDINKLKTLWKEVKQDNQHENNMQDTVKDSYHENNQFQNPENAQYQNRNQDNANHQLREKLDSLQFHLQKSQQTNDSLYKKLYQTEQELADSKQLIQRLQNEKQWKLQQMSDVNTRFGQLEHSQEEILGNARFNSQTLMIELEHRDREIRRLQDIIDERNDKLKVVSVTQERNLDKCMEFDKKIREIEDENQRLKQRLQDSSLQNDTLVLKQKAEGTFLVEVDHLRSDIQRLVKMLKNTAEFNNITEIADDPGFSIRFLKDVKATSYLDLDCNCKCRNIRPQCQACMQDEVIDEKMLWCPEEAWKFAHEFRLKYQGEMTDVLIERLLFELNKIWSKRETRLIQKVKASCAHETASLRRQLSFNPKYDEHQARATIIRLKNQLKQAYKENRELFAERQTRNPPGTKFVAETLKMTRNMSRTKKDADEKNKILKQKVNDYENFKYQDNSEKTLFMEGASWVCSKIQKESEKLSDIFKDYIKQFEMKERALLEEGRSHYAGGQKRKQDWLIENLESAIDQYTEQIKGFKKNSELEMTQAIQQAKKGDRPKSGYINTH